MIPTSIPIILYACRDSCQQLQLIHTPYGCLTSITVFGRLSDKFILGNFQQRLAYKALMSSPNKKEVKEDCTHFRCDSNSLKLGVVPRNSLCYKI